MRIKIVFFLIVGWLVFSHLLSQKNSFREPSLQLYERAEKMFKGPATDSTDAIALTYYTNILHSVNPNVSTARLLYNCYERSGILKQSLGYPPDAILRDYYAALRLQRSFQFSDSILFRLLLAAGNVHYNATVFDSAVYYFLWAEKIITHYPSAGLAGDLYNSLGVLYSEAGNYVQSAAYFNKALELTKKNHPELEEAIFAMSANIASAVRFSGFPDSALALYKKLLNTGGPSLAIINNISGIYLTKKEPDSALEYLHRIKNISGRYAITVYNAAAQAYMMKQDTVQAWQNLRAAESTFHLIAKQKKDFYYAATQKYLGDLMMMKKKPQQALSFYQQSIIQYDFKFNDTNVFVNPGNFIGEFASYNLFDALAAKAACFAVIYNDTKDEKYFSATAKTYDSAFLLADYIKKSIDNDEARLFIADKVFHTYIKAVDFLMDADTEKNETKWAQALEWISKSRATSLAINLKENAIKQYAGIPDSLLQKEKNSKINISRLRLRLQQSFDTTEQSELLSEINTAYLQLQSIENSLKNFPDYFLRKFTADSLDLRSIQKNILNDKTAAICYSKGIKSLYIFVIRPNEVTEHTIDIDPQFESRINEYTNQLTQSNSGKLYNHEPANALYRKLISPVINDISDISSLIIIPDENLINVPFEAFESGDNKYLIESFAITYQYALPLLQADKSKFSSGKAIAFAPYAYANANSEMSTLPASLGEVTSFPEKARFVSVNATKSRFLRALPDASVIHLATHAIVNFKEPQNSYIAFYEDNKADSAYKVFAHELYNFHLTKAKLVFLSACETGSGKLSQSEGALSLSRAFAFAGCPNIVTSLWKAEDNSTAYISKKFYSYVNAGYTYAQALQKARTDLINDEKMSQFHSPVYWSHLIFIGDVQQERSSVWIWIVILAAVGLSVYLLFLGRKLVKS